MTGTEQRPPGLSLESTLLFPISGNPIGFNHFAAAEWLLRRDSRLSRVCFVLSNGRHPDPTKRDAVVPAPERLRLCELACEAVADPARSFLAKQAHLAGERLRLTPPTMQISTLEFGFDRAVRTAELIPLLRAQAPGYAGPFHWCVGSDLVTRMADPRIFAEDDLRVLAANLHYHVLEREGAPLRDALAHLEETRGVRLDCTAHPMSEPPPWLGTFLSLSSTRIRNAAEAGDPLAGMLPAPAAEQVLAHGWYREGEPGARLVAPDGRELGTRSRLALLLEAQQAAVQRAAAELAEALLARRGRKEPHTLSLVETSTGGLVTAALAGRSGASRYFLQSRFAYDAQAKASLLAAGGEGAPSGSAVSEAAVLALAGAMRMAAGSDFALAESGMAGPPDAGRRSLKYGHCWFAVAGPDRALAETLQLNPFLTRREHQLAFARHALELATRFVASG
ncbi:MAG TPA: CinA family protein [bacterium]|nr:CinA family protein [bacterium]